MMTIAEESLVFICLIDCRDILDEMQLTDQSFISINDAFNEYYTFGQVRINFLSNESLSQR
jgi:hypothetical protein